MVHSQEVHLMHAVAAESCGRQLRQTVAADSCGVESYKISCRCINVTISCCLMRQMRVV